MNMNMNNWYILDHNKDKYNENQDDDLDNGLVPRAWGPPTWKSLHYISFGYPNNPTKEDMIHYRTYFTVIGYVLPCKSCRSSYMNFIKTGSTKMTDDVFKDRKSLTYWLYTVHEAVNKKIGVSYGISYEDLVKIYEPFRAKCSKEEGDKCISVKGNNKNDKNDKNDSGSINLHKTGSLSKKYKFVI